MGSHDERFEENTYLALNPDVAIAVRQGAFASGFEHWEKHGRHENRLCCDPLQTRDFDELKYLLRHPDVLAAVRQGTFRSGYEHWVRTGQAEGRGYRWFHDDSERYLNYNPDVAGAIAPGAFASASEHWSRCGRFEYRPGAASSWRRARMAVHPGRPIGINHFGYFGAASGLGTASSGYADAAASAGFTVERIETPDWADPRATTPTDIRSTARYRVNLIQQNADVIARWAARYGDTALPGAYNIALWVWELHAGYAQVYSASSALGEVWVPSRYVLDALRNVCAAPLFHIPYVVEPPSPALGPARAHLGIPESAFTFVYTFDVSSGFERKNPLALLHAFRLAFGDDRSVQLVLKYTRPESDTPSVALLERVAAPYANVRTIARTMSAEEHQQLILSADCFVSPHRSEGFGLNVAFALCSGKPVITTGYSGTVDFTDHSTAFLIDFSLVRVGPGNEPYHADYVWAEPDVDHLSALMREVRRNPDHARDRAALGRQYVLRHHSRTAVGELIRERLGRAGVLGDG